MFFLQIDGKWRVKLHFTLAEDLDDLKKKCSESDAYILFYDPTRPQTVIIYDSFIKDIIRTKHKAVRVVCLKPKRSNASLKRKSIKSKSVSSGWGVYHKEIVNKKDNESQMLILYRDIGTELIRERKLGSKKKASGACTILQHGFFSTVYFNLIKFTQMLFCSRCF